MFLYISWNILYFRLTKVEYRRIEFILIMPRRVWICWMISLGTLLEDQCEELPPRDTRLDYFMTMKELTLSMLEMTIGKLKHASIISGCWDTHWSVQMQFQQVLRVYHAKSLPGKVKRQHVGLLHVEISTEVCSCLNSEDTLQWISQQVIVIKPCLNIINT